MNKEVEQQNLEASREPDVGSTSLLDLFIGFLLVLVSGLAATLIAWWVL